MVEDLDLHAVSCAEAAQGAQVLLQEAAALADEHFRRLADGALGVLGAALLPFALDLLDAQDERIVSLREDDAFEDALEAVQRFGGAPHLAVLAGECLAHADVQHAGHVAKLVRDGARQHHDADERCLLQLAHVLFSCAGWQVHDIGHELGSFDFHVAQWREHAVLALAGRDAGHEAPREELHGLAVGFAANDELGALDGFQLAVATEVDAGAGDAGANHVAAAQARGLAEGVAVADDLELAFGLRLPIAVAQAEPRASRDGQDGCGGDGDEGPPSGGTWRGGGYLLPFLAQGGLRQQTLACQAQGVATGGRQARAQRRLEAQPLAGAPRVVLVAERRGEGVVFGVGKGVAIERAVEECQPGSVHAVIPLASHFSMHCLSAWRMRKRRTRTVAAFCCCSSAMAAMRRPCS